MNPPAGEDLASLCHRAWGTLIPCADHPGSTPHPTTTRSSTKSRGKPEHAGSPGKTDIAAPAAWKQPSARPR
ncbi:hypothetical protein GCM10010405_43280 [Streptomyces macrosporus]|uniref:Uncharacterized protein n=1 Tax=Streptomyces macrosporus TaxID=44032 RepID=A0ABN3KEM3_9ACTN